MNVSRRVGAYNFIRPDEEQANWSIHFELDGQKHVISQTVPLEGDYDLVGETDPWEVANAIEGYVKRLLYCSSKERTFETIKILRDNETQLRLQWNQQRVCEKEKKIQELEKEIARIKSETEELMETTK